MSITVLPELPDVLYKFRPLFSDKDWQHAIELIQKQEIRFPSTDKFNDPFEGHVSLLVPPGHHSAEEWAKKITAKYSSGNSATRREQGRKAMASVKRGFEINAPLSGLMAIGVCCLMDGAESLLAWAHYASGHKGVAFGFRTNVNGLENLFSHALRVEYVATKPRTNIVQDRASESSGTGILTKAECWAYEKEWRILADPAVPDSLARGARANGAGRFDPEDLVEVRFGVNMSDADKCRLADIVTGAGLQPKFLEATLHPTKFELVFKPWKPRKK